MKVVSLVLLLFVGLSSVAFFIQSIKAVEGTICIDADGSIDPSTAAIQREGAVYTFMDNVHDGIVVKRDDIVIDGDGYSLQGTGMGIYLCNRSNVKVQNLKIKDFDFGIRISRSSHISIKGNAIADNKYGIHLSQSHHNSISGNKITGNDECGIRLYGSLQNSISGNKIIENNGCGIHVSEYSNYNNISRNTLLTNSWNGIALSSSSHNIIIGNIIEHNRQGISLSEVANYNSICGNTVADNGCGISLKGASSLNSFYHNRFVDNDQQVVTGESSVNFWDDGEEGNYWSDYQMRYPESEQLDGSGIGDTVYVIDEDNLDHYPLIKRGQRDLPWLWIAMGLIAVTVVLMGVIFLKKR
ncbi:MAG: right-handed parallel beta-helix repeat-containing protein [Thermoproteota archaeon]